jgi:hypothetical protein
MTQWIYVCERSHGVGDWGGDLRTLADRIAPPVQGLGDHRIITAPGAWLGLVRPVGPGIAEATAQGLAGRVGVLQEGGAAWRELGSGSPEGAFALVRSDAHRVELCTDFVGSRSIWYAFDDQRLVASTSLRALLALLPGSEPHPRSLAWFISSGAPGPEGAWDRRVRQVPADAIVTLDRVRWVLDVAAHPVEFSPKMATPDQWQRRFEEVLDQAVRDCELPGAGWILPLSGGYDSRLLLSLLGSQGRRLPAVTWGREAALRNPRSDAHVAVRLAREAGLDHRYLVTDHPEESAEGVVDAFLATHGGTTESLFSYLDGMAMWRGFAREGVQGIIRGDQGFGFSARPAKDAQIAVGLLLPQDLFPESEAEALADGLPQVPDHLLLQPGESDQTYADRLYHAYRMPFGLAALNDVKAPHVEIANPFLARSVQETLRTMPDALRADRALYCRVVERRSPPIPFATEPADDQESTFIHTPAFEAWMRAELQGERAQSLLPEGVRARLLASLTSQVAAQAPAFRTWLKRVLPKAVVKALTTRLPHRKPPMRRLAFRAALAMRILAQREGDQAALAAARAGLPVG